MQYADFRMRVDWSAKTRSAHSNSGDAGDLAGVDDLAVIVASDHCMRDGVHVVALVSFQVQQGARNFLEICKYIPYQKWVDFLATHYDNIAGRLYSFYRLFNYFLRLLGFLNA